MANRFPLIVNPVSKKIEELSAADHLDLSSSSIYAGGSLGSIGQYLKSNGTSVEWDNPGDVYLTTTQTLTNKTIESSFISGITNTFTNIPNSALVNNSISVNGVAIALGGTVTTPDNNTTYSVSAQDGAAGKKIIRLTSGGNSGAGVDDDVTLVAGTNVALARTGDEITITSSYVDTNTITRVAASGGTLVSGDITIAASGAASVAQVGSTITVSAVDTNTVTRLRGTAAGTYTSGDLQLLADGATSVVQAGSDITISSTDTVTRVRGTAGTLTSGDITIAAGGSSTVAQVGSTITISSSYVDTITRVRGGTAGTYTSGDLTIAASGAASVSQAGNTITVNAIDTNTTYTAGDALTLSGTVFSLTNTSNLTNARHIKWDSGNSQLINSIVSDDGTTVTVAGNLTVTGTTSTIDSQTLIIADAQIELRKGNSIVGADGGVQINRTTSSLGVVTAYSALQWYETGAYWRVYNGSIANRLVTEGETQTLTNKTLTAPTLTTPSLGVATATTVNGLSISAVVSGTLTIANNKTFTCNNTLTFSGTDTSTIGFGNGGTVAYTANNLSSFASTTSTQLRGVISDETGSGNLVFGTSPTFTTSVVTNSTTIAVFNTVATTVNAFGTATTLNLGATSGTTTIKNNADLDKSVILGSVVGDVITVNGTATFANADINIRSSSPIAVGRGGGAVVSNTRVGFNALNSNSTGSQNTAIGYESALTINVGAGIVAIGYQALRSASTGQYNVAIGRSAGTAILGGAQNVAIGANALEQNTIGDNNVCVGYYAGAGATGSGNVLIGPAPDANSTNSTFQPPTLSGDKQLVIGSGTGTWVRGDSNFDITFPQNANVGGNFIVGGNLTVNGTTTTINSNILSVDDKELALADVSNQTFVATIVSGSPNITGVTPTAGLIPGMDVSISTAGLSVPGGTTIVSITNNTAVLSGNVTGSSGTATFNAVGPSDTAADGAGIRIKGTTDKTLTWSAATTAFTSTENFDLAGAKQYRIGNVLIASSSQIGPSTGSFSLGAGVTTSSLTQVGTLTSLTVTGAITANGGINLGGINLGDNDIISFGDSNDLQIYHNGANSIIKDVGTGGLQLFSEQTDILNSSGTEVAAKFFQDGAVELYHNNAKKFETTSTGATVTGNFEPEADATRDLGSATKRWANIYSADLQLSNEGAANEVDGTWGQYTIQEGEDDLFLINRRNGKKYKFMLQEVN